MGSKLSRCSAMERGTVAPIVVAAALVNPPPSPPPTPEACPSTKEEANVDAGSRSEFLESVATFVNGAKSEPDHMVNVIKQSLEPAERASVDAQLRTFQEDMGRMTRGEMTYSEMRSMYG